MSNRPGCPGCGGAADRERLFCLDCWSYVPTAVRKRLEAARKALGRNYTTAAATEFDQVIAEAAGHVR